ncbi:hypothetical protein [Pseudomonas sp. Pseusp97]|uniref:hypothetical protein n=1 Tax=Pseudomonas sp. Pseusp97 TaxID=3243065 RepID=UPI0039A6C47D
MVIIDRVFCDLCRAPLGQLWNQPAQAPDLPSSSDFHVCDDCFAASSPVDGYQFSDLVVFQGDSFGTCVSVKGYLNSGLVLAQDGDIGTDGGAYVSLLAGL